MSQPSTGMITRHFDHPSGATATLEFPAGYGNRTYYKLTIRNADGSEAVPPETKQYSTSHEARVGAVEREREAMRNGWRPRMAAIDQGSRQMMTLYREDGRPLGCRVIGWTSRQEHEDFNIGRLRAARTEYEIEAESSGEIPTTGNLIVVIGHGSEQMHFMMAVQLVQAEERGWGAPTTFTINGVTIPSDTASLPTIVANAVLRETLIANYDNVEPLPSYSILWAELSTAVPDHASRAVLVQEIITRRNERDVGLRRLREGLARAEATAAGLRVEQLPARRTPRTAPSTPAAPQPQPGADLSKPKQRKIKLGD